MIVFVAWAACLGVTQFDSITVVDVAREFQNLLAQKNTMLPPTVKPEVLERVLAIATELAVEGREGHQSVVYLWWAMPMRSLNSRSRLF